MQNDEQAIRHLISTWLDASNAGEHEKVLKLMDEDAVFLGPGRPPMRGRAAFAAAQAAQRHVRFEASAEIQEIRVFGDWAYAWTELTVTQMPDDGPVVKRAGPTLSVLHKERGEWLFYRDANMLAVV